MNGPSDVGGRMWVEACELIEQAERLHRQFFRPSVAAPATWEPPVDVFEDARGWIVSVAMPGVTVDRVEVLIDGDTLVVRGIRPLTLAGTGYRVRRLEIPYGAFERRIALPPGRFELDAPELANGCLVLHLRKREGR